MNTYVSVHYVSELSVMMCLETLAIINYVAFVNQIAM